MQGVSLLKQKTRQKSKKQQRPPVRRKIKPEEIKISHIPRSSTKIISSTGESKKIEIREISSLQDELPKTSPGTDEAIEVQKIDKPQEEKKDGLDIKAKTERSYAEPEVPSESLLDITSEPSLETEEVSDKTAPSDVSFEDIPSFQETPSLTLKPVEEKTEFLAKPETKGAETKSVEADETLEQADKKYETEIVSEEDSLEKADDIIEKQIATLEKDLAMQCPMCKSGKIQTKKTGTGKVYYKCSNKTCNFISWGKPYHFVCPQCNNPFLIETSVKDGKTILKCPRSTCRYSQNLPGEITEEPEEKAFSQVQKPKKSTEISRKPRRRVVKRRVVRRKR